MKVLTFGELLLRLSAPGYNKLFQKDSLECSFGGSEANVAVSLANFGLESIFVTKFPDNDVGIAAERSLKYFGVDTSKIVYGDGRMGLYYLEKGISQRPSKIIYDRSFSSISLAKKKEFDWDRLFEGVDWFHFTGINPALSKSMYEITLEACKTAKKKGITISCDLNYRKKLWTSEEAQNTMKILIKYVDVCIANEEDVQLSLGLQIDDNNIEQGRLNLNGYKVLSSKLREEFGCKYVAFSMRESFSASRNGWSGLIYDGRHVYQSKKYDIQLVDRVGGGDSFAAGIIYGLINGMTAKNTIEFATAASCLKQTIEGDYSRATVEDINLLIETGGNGRVRR